MSKFDYHNDFVVPVLTGQLDEFLDGMIQTIQLRQKDKAPKASDFNVGDVVRYVGGVRPKYLAGVKGTIHQINRTKVVVKLDKPVGRFHGLITTPTNLIEKV